MISWLLHESEAKPGTSINDYSISQYLQSVSVMNIRCIYVLYKAEKPSVCLTVTPITQSSLHGSTWDLVCVELLSLACEACFDKYLRAFCWAHERFKHSDVVLFAIIFSCVKF